MDKGLLTLNNLKMGQMGRLTGFAESLPAVYKKRLEELGFHIGENVTCLVSPKMGAPRVYGVESATYSLEKSIAELILWEPISNE